MGPRWEQSDYEEIKDLIPHDVSFVGSASGHGRVQHPKIELSTGKRREIHNLKDITERVHHAFGAEGFLVRDLYVEAGYSGSNSPRLLIVVEFERGVRS